MLDRRQFLAASGALFVTGLSARAAFGFAQTDGLFISTCQRADGSYAAAIVSEQGEVLHWVNLPARGHDTLVSRTLGQAVIFARRPGTFAISLDLARGRPPLSFAAPPGRHFYGHGAFSANGKILFAAENDYENGRGIIGLYEVASGFSRIGEFYAHGIGPHELALMPDGKTLVVANGGIETHPDFGRAKLNLDTMAPSICFIDHRDGTLLERQALPASAHQLSLRHLSVAPDNTVWFAGQFQGARTTRTQLIGSARQGGGIRFLNLPETEVSKFQNYISSIKFDAQSGLLAASSSIGSRVALIDTGAAKVVQALDIDAASGIGFAHGELIATGRRGALRIADQNVDADIKWDNHIGL